MRTSKLLFEIDMLKLKHDYEEKTLKMKNDLELRQLLNTCNHKYDDGSNAMSWKGMQHNGYEVEKREISDEDMEDGNY